MADTINIILDYLHKNKFSRAEGALRAEISTRENSNGAVSLQLNDELDLDVSTLFQSLQYRASAQLRKAASDIEKEGVILDMARNPDTCLMNSTFERNMDECQQRSTSEPEKSVFVDFGVHQQGKSAFLHAVGVNKGNNKDLSVGPSSNQGAVASSANRRVVNTLARTGLELEPPNERVVLQQEYVPEFSATSSADKKLARMSGNEDTTTSKVDELELKLREIEDASFEGDRLAESSDMAGNSIEQVQSPQWFGIKVQVRSGAQRDLKIAPRTVTLRPPVKRPVSEQDKRKVHNEKRDKDVFQLGNGEKLTLGCGKVESSIDSKLPVNERGGFVQVLSEDLDRVYYGRGAGDLTNSLSTGVAVRDPELTTQGKSVSVKTSFLFPCAEPAVPREPLLVWGQKGDVRVSGYEHIGSPRVSESANLPQGMPLTSRTDSAIKGVREAEEELPKLPPVRLRTGDNKSTDIKEGLNGGSFKSSVESGFSGVLGGSSETVFDLGLFLDVPLGQDVSSSGTRRLSGGSRPSVSQGIVEDISETLSGFATVGDGQSEALGEYPDGYWDSDTYDDDDDPGYHRKPIEDGEWFLAHEIDYPDERSSPNLGNRDKEYGKFEDDDHSFLEEESYFSGEEYYRGKRAERRDSQSEFEHLSNIDLYKCVEESRLGALRSQSGSQMYGPAPHEEDKLHLTRAEPKWKGFVAQDSQLEDEGQDKLLHERAALEDVGSVMSAGVGVSSDVAEFGSEVRESVVGGSSEGGDFESVRDREIGRYGVSLSKEVPKNAASKSRCRFNDVESTQEVTKVEIDRNCHDEEVDHDMIFRYYSEAWSQKKGSADRQPTEVHRLYEQGKGERNGNNGNTQNHVQEKQEIGGFSFPSPSRGEDLAVMSRADSTKSLWSVRDIGPGRGDDGDEFANGVIGPDDTLAVWKRKSNESSPIISPRAMLRMTALSPDSTVSAPSTDGYGSGEVKQDENEEEEELEINLCNRDESEAVADDEEAAAVQEQVQRIRAEEDEFETFNLKIVHRKNRTGFEEDKDFPVVINSVIAGRYHVTEYLGSAAFSQAIQAHDLHTGMDVCMKIIKNNKDFFDQSLDEIKLLKYINKNDPGDKHHVLRLYDYFYHREHLFIVCELLRANLYEFHKYNRESGGEVYFTMPRLQSITRQCLEALDFIHGLGLIHCDLKPENILVKSYSRCEVKVIDLGSSCFQTDHLCSYVQSRSYRAPEVILGLPYNHKIDMWSLGCILSELCSGIVLFQNDSLATLLARVVGILGPLDPDMLAKGRDSHKFFTKTRMIYERNKETNQLEYLLPKKTSLAHRLPMGDQGFVDFVGYLLQISPASRPTAQEALRHPWLSYPYEPISS